MAGEPGAPAAPVAPLPGTPEHEAAMVAKADAVNATGDPALPQGGDLVPQAPAADPPPAADKAAETPPADAPKSVDIKALSAEFQEKGELSEDTYKSLETLGFDKGFVDSYIEGQKALAAARDEIGFAEAGGSEQFTKMAEWAGENLPADEVEALNKGLAGSIADMKTAVRGLRASYEKQFGSDPTLLKGSSSQAAQAGGYASRAEVTAAMKDPRYKADPAYRREVERRTGLTDW